MPVLQEKGEKETEILRYFYSSATNNVAAKLIRWCFNAFLSLIETPRIFCQIYFHGPEVFLRTVASGQKFHRKTSVRSHSAVRVNYRDFTSQAQNKRGCYMHPVDYSFQRCRRCKLSDNIFPALAFLHSTLWLRLDALIFLPSSLYFSFAVPLSLCTLCPPSIYIATIHDQGWAQSRRLRSHINHSFPAAVCKLEYTKLLAGRAAFPIATNFSDFSAVQG